MTTRTRIVRIGNSQGVRLPKAVLAASGLAGEVEIEAADGQVVIRPARHPRDGWEEAAREMHANGDDRLLDPEITSEWDQTEWTWGDNKWDT